MKIVMVILLSLVLIACGSSNYNIFIPASFESQETAKTKAKYIGADTSNIHSGTTQIHECLFDQIGGKCLDKICVGIFSPSPFYILY